MYNIERAFNMWCGCLSFSTANRNPTWLLYSKTESWSSKILLIIYWFVFCLVFLLILNQANHRFTTQMQRRNYGHATEVAIRPLNEEKAVQAAADLLGELFVFTVLWILCFIHCQKRDMLFECKMLKHYPFVCSISCNVAALPYSVGWWCYNFQKHLLFDLL